MFLVCLLPGSLSFLCDVLRSAIRSGRDCGSGEFVYVHVCDVVCSCCAWEMAWLRLRIW